MTLPMVPDVSDCRRRLERIFPPGISARNDLVREMAAKTVALALYVGAVGDPDAAAARCIRPSMVAWMSDEAMDLRTDDAFRLEWYRAARSGRRSVEALLSRRATPHRPWYADTTREPIRDEILRPMRERYGAVLGRQGIATTSPAPSMVLASDFAEIFDPSISDAELDARIKAWGEAHLSASEQLRLRALSQLDPDGSKIRVDLPGRGTRVLPPGHSSVLVASFMEHFVPRFVGSAYVLALCHGGDPTASEDRHELEKVGLPLVGGPALPDIVMLALEDGRLWLAEVVVSAGEVNDGRRDALLAWASMGGIDPGHCALLTIFRSRSDPAARRSMPRLAWGAEVWFADEPQHRMHLA